MEETRPSITLPNSRDISATIPGTERSSSFVFLDEAPCQSTSPVRKLINLADKPTSIETLEPWSTSSRWSRVPVTRHSGDPRPSNTSTDWKSPRACIARSEEHTSELQSRQYLVCRLLLEKKK